MRLETLEMTGESWESNAEHVYAGGNDNDRVEDVPDSADMDEERGCE